jgi:hypothetical protein
MVDFLISLLAGVCLLIVIVILAILCERFDVMGKLEDVIEIIAHKIWRFYNGISCRAKYNEGWNSDYIDGANLIALILSIHVDKPERIFFGGIAKKAIFKKIVIPMPNIMNSNFVLSSKLVHQYSLLPKETALPLVFSAKEILDWTEADKNDGPTITGYRLVLEDGKHRFMAARIRGDCDFVAFIPIWMKIDKFEI